MKRMLFNATQAEELRVAIVDGQKLIDLDIESAAKEERKSNIYKAVITRIEPSLEAAFVDYGSDRHGFLPFKEIARTYFSGNGEGGKARIQDVLSVGQELIVQVEKDERGNKGAALTTYISLAGRYLVLMPNNPRGGGVSRRVEGDERAELRDVMDQLDVPSGMSLIARTAAIGRAAEELQWDLNYLMQLWLAIEGAATSQNGAFLIYQEGSLVIRAIRDYFQPDIGEILIDTDDVFEQARQFMAHVMPDNVGKVKRYNDDVPLFSRFQIEHQIESAYARQVTLPSGGAVVIDHTEALVSIDVNSGRATKGSDIEETALRTNIEAAEEIARQLRLRDLGGLIVIDFIDMESQKNQREVENCLRDALHHDRARVQTGKISRFGLLELSRQRLRPALSESSYEPCPRCNGTGHIRSTESSALHILRILEEEAMKENTGAVHLQVPVDVGTFLLNEKRTDISRIELRHKIQLIIVPNRHLETPHHEIIRLRHDQLNAEDIALASYKMVAEPPADNARMPGSEAAARPPRPEAVVKGIAPTQPAPSAPTVDQAPVAAVAESGKGLIDRLFGWLRRSNAPTPTQEPTVSTATETPKRGADARPARGERNERGDRGDRRGDGRRGGRNRRDGEREERVEEAQPARGRGNRRTEPTERTERPDRSDRAERTEREPAAQAAIGATEGSTGGRGRRGRGSRAEPKAEDALVENAAVAAAVAAEEASVTETVSENPTPATENGDGAAPRRRRRRGRRGRGGADRQEGSVNEAGNGEDTDEDAESRTEEGASTSEDAAPRFAVEQSEVPSFESAPAASEESPIVTTEAGADADIVTPESAPATETSALESAPVSETPALETAESAPAPITEAPAEPTRDEIPAVERMPLEASVQDVAPEAPSVDTAPAEEEVAAPEPIAAVTAPVQATPPEPITAAPAAEPIDLGKPLADAGLVLIETRPGNTSNGIAQQPQVPLGRQPRRPAAVPQEPLQQIETGNK